MFKISAAYDPCCDRSGQWIADNDDFKGLSAFCTVEPWSSDLEHGIFCLGPTARGLHDLAQSDCGLLTLVRCYTQEDRSHILSLFEQAATDKSSFCFSTFIEQDGIKQPVFCMGHSCGETANHISSIRGVFLFPRFAAPQG